MPVRMGCLGFPHPPHTPRCSLALIPLGNALWNGPRFPLGVSLVRRLMLFVVGKLHGRAEVAFLGTHEDSSLARRFQTIALEFSSGSPREVRRT